MRTFLKLSTLLTALATTGLLFAAVGQTHAAETIKLKFASPFPMGHPSEVLAEKFIAEIEKSLGKKVEVSYFPAEQLGKAKDMLSVCGRGIADICQIHITYFAGQLPYNNTIVLPLWTTGTEGSTIYQWMLENVPELQEEFKQYGVHALEGNTTGSYNVATTDKPVRKLEDMSGLKLKTAGGLFDNIAKRYGIIPVSIPASETYEAVQRGVVNGVVFNYPSIKAYHLNDLLKYINFGMRAGGYPDAMIINQKTWEKLPKEYQAAIEKASHDIANIAGVSWDQQQDTVRKEFKEQGIQIYDLTPEQQKTWAQKLDGLTDEYIAEMEKRGFTKIRNVVTQYKSEVARVVK